MKAKLEDGREVELVQWDVNSRELYLLKEINPTEQAKLEQCASITSNHMPEIQVGDLVENSSNRWFLVDGVKPNGKQLVTSGDYVIPLDDIIAVMSKASEWRRG